MKLIAYYISRLYVELGQVIAAPSADDKPKVFGDEVQQLIWDAASKKSQLGEDLVKVVDCQELQLYHLDALEYFSRLANLLGSQVEGSDPKAAQESIRRFERDTKLPTRFRQLVSLAEGQKIDFLTQNDVGYVCDGLVDSLGYMIKRKRILEDNDEDELAKKLVVSFEYVLNNAGRHSTKLGNFRRP